MCMSTDINGKGPPIAKPQNHLFLKDFDLLDNTIFCQFVQQSLEYDFFYSSFALFFIAL